MAEPRTLARPYAKAAFEAASEKQALDTWSQQLATLAQISGEEKVAALIASPAIYIEKKVSALAGLVGESLDTGVLSFIGILAENNRLALLPVIFELFNELKAARERSIDVTISSAFPLGDETENALCDALRTRLERDIRVETQVDQSLLGGVVIRAGDIVIDGSVKGRLSKLAEAMNL